MTDLPLHARPPEDALAAMEAGPRGLSQAEAEARLARHGPNRLPEPPRRGPLRRLLAQFANVLIYVLLGAAAVTAWLGHWVDTAVILAVVLVNALVGFVQEGRAEQAMAALRDLLAPQARVLRDGSPVTLPGEALVPGDIVLLEAGDRVPADLRLIEARALAAEEAMLTGESVPVEKGTGAVAPDAPLGDRRGMVWSGTLITRGAGRGVVTATGPATEIGRIGGLLAAIPPMTTPLLAQIDRFARLLSFTLLAAAAALLLWGLWAGRLPFAELFMAVVGVTVAAIPEGLPAVITITLALGVQGMARRRAIVRRLPAIEAIGAVTVICTDKTGTLTRNEMAVADAVTAAGQFAIGGEGYAPEGEIAPQGDLAPLARAARLCNDAALRATPEGWHVTGDPMEGALLAFAGKAGAPEGWIRLDAIPFDSATRYMATLDAGPSGERLVHVKGAPERVFPMCRTEWTPGPESGGPRPLDAEAWAARADALAGEGRRVLALACAEAPADRLDGEPQGLVLLGLLGLIDPPRPEAVAAVADCRRAGIRVKMITGDHAGTAAAIARAVGLRRTDRVLTGADLAAMDEATFREEAWACDVFARTSPEDKLRLVEAFQARGAIVAMTGDGVNDSPALRRADIGVAMGLKGSEAAKEASDLVLADDNFATIAAAVREGRTVYDNIRKVIAWTLPTNGGEALTVVLALLLGLALPVTPVQILWINLATAVTLGLALAFEPSEPGTMARPPRPPKEPILTPRLVWHVLFVSALFLVWVFGLFAWAKARAYPLALAQTMALNMLVVLEIFHLFYVRRMNGTSLAWDAVRGTRAVWITVLGVTAAQFVVTYWPPAQRVFGTVAVPLWDGMLIVALGWVFLAVLEVEKQVRLRAFAPRAAPAEA